MISIIAMTDIASKWVFDFDLLIARCWEQLLGFTAAFATYDIPFISNGLLATFYVQWGTHNDNFLPTFTIIAS